MLLVGFSVCADNEPGANRKIKAEGSLLAEAFIFLDASGEYRDSEAIGERAFWDRVVNMAIGKLWIQFGETSDFCQKVWFCQKVLRMNIAEVQSIYNNKKRGAL